MTWFERMKKGIRWPGKKREIPDGLWMKCPSCKAVLWSKRLQQNQEVCPDCEYHFRIGAPHRIELMLDAESFVELDAHVRSKDVLGFPEYRKKIRGDQKRTGLPSVLIGGCGRIESREIVIGVSDARFRMGSMASAMGEKIRRLILSARERGWPLILVSGSGGGARMQEGTLSLMQMAKTAALLGELARDSIPYILVLTDPTGGGVTASFAMLGDINIAEPGAKIMFTGRPGDEFLRGQEIPLNFQTAEFFFERGMVDRIVHRHQLRAIVAQVLGLLQDGRMKR